MQPKHLAYASLLMAFGAVLLPYSVPLPPLTVIDSLSDTQLSSLATDLSSWLLQLAGATTLVVGVVAFTAVQASGGLVGTRKLRAVLNKSVAAVACWFTLILVIAQSTILRIEADSGSHDDLARATSWSVISFASTLLSIAAIFLEQVYFSNLDHLARDFSGHVTAAAIRKFGFISGASRSTNIQRYNLDFQGPDPVGALSEIFSHSVEAHDRVLLQLVCDALASRATESARVRLRMETLQAIYAGRLNIRAPLRRRVERHADDATVVCLYVTHFFVRNASNLRRKWRIPTARHPFLLSALRMLRALGPHYELRPATRICAEGIAVIILAARRETPWATREPYGAVALVAIDMWNLGHRDAAVKLWQAYTICGLDGNPDLFPSPPASLVPPELARITAVTTSRFGADPAWLPGRRNSLWMQMLPELQTRAQ